MANLFRFKQLSSCSNSKLRIIYPTSIHTRKEITVAPDVYSEKFIKENGKKPTPSLFTSDSTMSDHQITHRDQYILFPQNPNLEML